MKKFALALVFLLLCGAAQGQPANQQQSVPYCPTGVFDANGVPATQPCGYPLKSSTAVASAATITLTPTSTQFVYIVGVRIQNCAGASAVSAAAVTTITTTNLPTGTAWTLGSGTTAGACVQDIGDFFGLNAMKATAATTAVTLVLPVFATNQTVRVQVYWYSAP